MACPLDWPRLFPTADYRFHLGLRPGNPSRFFQPSADHAATTRERRRWLDENPQRYAAFEGQAKDLLEETLELAGVWGSLDPSQLAELRQARALSPTAAGLALGAVWEPDFLLLAALPDGRFRLEGGVVCFPSSWALREKLGLTVGEIHTVVPGLNPALGRQIDTFLERTAASPWERENWGLSPDAELNRHPARGLPPLAAGAAPETVWVRVEHQIFVRLPRTHGLLFGIRITLHPLREVLGTAGARAGLARALSTMPDEVARYKGLTEARASLLAALAIGPTLRD